MKLWTEKKERKRLAAAACDRTAAAAAGDRTAAAAARFRVRSGFAAVCIGLCAALLLTGCGRDKGEKETGTAETEQVETAGERYPGTLAVEEERGSDSPYYGVMHADVIDIQKGSDGHTTYMLRDDRDPDNVWAINEAEISYIGTEITAGGRVAVLFNGDMISDEENVRFIAVTDDGKYEIKSLTGTVTANMMATFTVSRGGTEISFIKDNCRIEKDALTADGVSPVLVYYAACGSSNYPFVVYKARP